MEITKKMTLVKVLINNYNEPATDDGLRPCEAVIYEL